MLEADEQVDVHDRPEHPGQPSFELGAPDLEHGGMTADDRRVASAAIGKRLQRGILSDPGGETVAKVAALLLRHLRKSGQWLAIDLEPRDVADRKDILRARDGECGLDKDAPRLVMF